MSVLFRYFITLLIVNDSISYIFMYSLIHWNKHEIYTITNINNKGHDKINRDEYQYCQQITT